MHQACLGLGSNTVPERYLPAALLALSEFAEIVAVSSAWQSPAVGVPGADYLNAALLIRTALDSQALTAALKRIESTLGRARGALPHAIEIDIDLLLFDDAVLDSSLWSLAYRSVPLADLLPELPSPETGETLAQAAQRLTTTTPIRVRPEILDGYADDRRSPLTPSSTRTQPPCPT